MKILNILREGYHNFIRTNSCYPTQVIIHPIDVETLMDEVKVQMGAEFNMMYNGKYHYRGLIVIRSLDVEENEPIFVTTEFKLR